MSTEDAKTLEKGQSVYVGPFEFGRDIWRRADGQYVIGPGNVPAAYVIPARTVDEVAEPLATVQADPVDRKQAGEMRLSERAELRNLAGSLLTDENPLATTAAIEALEKWVDVFGRDRFTAGIDWERERAEPSVGGRPTGLKSSIIDRIKDAVADAQDFDDGRNRTRLMAALAARDTLEKLMLETAQRLFDRGVNAVYDDAESGIDRKGFVVYCPGCRYLNCYPGGFAPSGCGNCGRDLSNQPRYREVARVEDVPVLELIEEEPAATAAHHDMRCPVCGSLDRDVLDDGETVCVACGNQWWPEPKPIARASHYNSGYASATEHTNALNQAYSDGYRTGHMHGSNVGLWLDGMAIPGREPVEAEGLAKREHEHKEAINAAYSDGYRTGKMHAGRGARFLSGEDLEEPEAEAAFVHVTVSRKGRITASGPAPDVLAVLRGVLELEDEGSSLWGMPVVKTAEVPEGMIVVKPRETPESQAIREAFRAAERRHLSEPRGDKPTQQE